MRRFKFSLALAFGLAFAGNVFAQGTTSALNGTVTSDGKPLPGASVTVSAPTLQGTRTAFTGENGGYSFAAIPPGDYTVEFQLQGLQPVKKTVRLLLAQTTRVDADLKLSAVAETIEVVGTTPAAAVLETTQMGSNFTNKEISQLPISRTIRDTVLLAPGVNANGVNNQITISGGPSYDNLFLVDGVVVNENLRGQPHNLFIEDAIQESTILTGSISSEYGRFTGGVVSTLTKSGGNRFHGSLRDSFSNPDWTEKTPFPTEADHVKHTDQVYEGTLGGRVIPDHLWFFGAARLAERSSQRFTANTNIPITNSFDETRLEGKLTANITSAHTFSGSYIDIKNDETNNIFAPILDLESVVPSRSLPNTLLAINYNGVLGKNFVAEAQYSKKEFTFVNSGGRFTDRIRGTWIQDRGTGGRYNAPVFCGVCDPEERNNDSWLAKGTYYWNAGSLGNHSVVLGVEDFKEERISNNYQSASQFQILASSYVNDPLGTVFPRFDDRTEITWRPIFVLSPGTDFETQSAFVNDSWDLNKHFSFNIGLRYDKNDGKDATGNTVSNDSAFSPRIATSWDPKGEGRGRFTATYARYVSKIADGNVGGSAQAAGNPAAFTFTYGGPVINPATLPASQRLSTRDALTQLFAWFDSVGGTNNRSFLISSFFPGFATSFESSLTSPSVDEFTLGYGTQIGQTAYAKVDLISREWDNFYAARLNLGTGQITDPFGNRGDRGITVNDDGSISRKYRGMQFQSQWRPGRFSTGLSYTYSTLKGNDQGEGGGTATIRNLPLATWYPEYLSYPNRLPSGYLAQDQRHRAKLWVGYDLPTPIGGFTFSALQSYDTGTPYSAIGQIDATGRVAGTAYPGLPMGLGYTLSQAGTSHDYFFSARGEFRTEDYYRTDIAINYSTPKFFGVELFLKAFVTNLFDNGELVNPNADVITARTSASARLSPFNPRTDRPIECTRRDPANSSRCAQDFGTAHWLKGPNFGKASGVGSYQLSNATCPVSGICARTYGLSAGLRF